jgi:uncharacterized membrane protein YdjX (TVP38/TMEM64 family)
MVTAINQSLDSMYTRSNYHRKQSLARLLMRVSPCFPNDALVYHFSVFVELNVCLYCVRNNYYYIIVCLV